MKKLVHVAVGVIFDTHLEPGSESYSRNILIAKRADHQHQGGLWEFPGGKVEDGESVQSALQRELEEELGLLANINDMRPLISIPFHYPDKSVVLDVWIVPTWTAPRLVNNPSEKESPSLIGKEGQPLVWVEQKNITDYQFPEANKAIIDALVAL